MGWAPWRGGGGVPPPLPMHPWGGGGSVVVEGGGKGGGSEIQGFGYQKCPIPPFQNLVFPLRNFCRTRRGGGAEGGGGGGGAPFFQFKHTAGAHTSRYPLCPGNPNSIKHTLCVFMCLLHTTAAVLVFLR